MCATCHVYVREPYLGALPELGEEEDEMLEETVAPRDALRSRLGCQVLVGGDLDEIEVARLRVLQRLVAGDHADLLAIVADEAHFRHADALVDTR